MYKLEETESPVTYGGYTLRSMREKFNLDDISDLVGVEELNYHYRGLPYTLPLRRDAEFVPITNIFSSPISTASSIGTVEEYKSRLDAFLSTFNASYYKGSDLNELIKEETDEFSKRLYMKLISQDNSKISEGVVIRMAKNASTALRVREMCNVISGRNIVKIYGSVKGFRKTNLVFPFYYVVNDVIVFSMMIKREKVSYFRQQWMQGYVDPSVVEIWIDKNFFELNDKTTFSKWIKEKFIMKLVMQGFTIRIKDNINEEVIPVFKPKCNSISEYEELKQNIARVMLNPTL